MANETIHTDADSESVDEHLSLLTNRHCRSVISYLQDSSEVISVPELANELGEENQGDVKRLSIQLHHSVLPRLADADVVDYDTESKTIQYRGHSELETLLARITG